MDRLYTKEEKQRETKLFSKRLDYIMQLRHFTNATLAEAMYCSVSAINGYRTGRRLPDIITVSKLCDVLEISADFLLGRTDELQEDE